MSFKPGDAYYRDFTTSDPTTGAAADADAMPTATVYVNGTAADWGEAVAKVATGLYRITGAIPPALAAGDVVSVVAAATVAGAAGVAVVDSFILDAKRIADLNDLAAGAVMDLVDAPNAAAIAAMQSGLAGETELATAQTTLTAVKAKTDLITIGRIAAVSPVAEDGDITITAGDDYAAASGTALAITIEGYAGPDLDGATAWLRIVAKTEYDAGDATAYLAVSGSISESGADATFSFDLTATQTAALMTSPPADSLAHIYQLVIIDDAGNAATAALGAMTVSGRIGEGA